MAAEPTWSPGWTMAASTPCPLRALLDKFLETYSFTG
jgi:hypothetical protein